MIAFQFLCFWYFGNPTAGIKNAKFNSTLKESCPREQLFLVYYIVNYIVKKISYKVEECTKRSTNLLEYPISLSYQETTFTKVGESIIPASLSKIEVRLSPTKS